MLFIHAGATDRLLKQGKVVLRTPVGGRYASVEEGFYIFGEERFSSADLIAKHPLGTVGTRLQVSVRELFGKSRVLGVFSIASLSLQFLEDISDEQIVAEGYANWSEYAYGWNQLNPKSPWDLNPLCWVIELSSR